MLLLLLLPRCLVGAIAVPTDVVIFCLLVLLFSCTLRFCVTAVLLLLMFVFLLLLLLLLSVI